MKMPVICLSGSFDQLQQPEPRDLPLLFCCNPQHSSSGALRRAAALCPSAQHLVSRLSRRADDIDEAKALLVLTIDLRRAPPSCWPLALAGSRFCSRPEKRGQPFAHRCVDWAAKASRASRSGLSAFQIASRGWR